MDNTQLPADYNPIGCKHKHSNGFSSWQFQSEEQSNLGGANKVSIHVCSLCGEINIGGYRPSKDEKYVNHFHETFNIYSPSAIDAIIKQANFYNEEAKWGRIDEYAINLLQEQQENKNISDQNDDLLKENRRLLALAERTEGKLKLAQQKIDEFASEIESVGTLIKDHEAAHALLKKIAFRHEGGLLPDTFIYKEIINFLHGK